MTITFATIKGILDRHRDNPNQSTAGIASALGVDEGDVRHVRKVYKHYKACMTKERQVQAAADRFAGHDDDRRAISDLVVLYVIYCKYPDHHDRLVPAILHIAGEYRSRDVVVLQIVGLIRAQLKKMNGENDKFSMDWINALPAILCTINKKSMKYWILALVLAFLTASFFFWRFWRWFMPNGSTLLSFGSSTWNNYGLH